MKKNTVVVAALFTWAAVCFGHFQFPGRTSIKHKLDVGAGLVVRSVLFSPDEKTLAVACGNDISPGEIQIYSVESGKLLGTLREHKKPVDCIAFTLDGSLLISGGRDKRCIIWDTATKKSIGSLEGHAKGVHGISISPDGKSAVTSSADETLVSWDLANRRPIAKLKNKTEVISLLARSRDGKFLAGGSAGRSAR